MPERLNALDASFLCLERPHLHMHVGGLAVFDPADSSQGPLTLERLRDLTAQRIHLVPRWRQGLVTPSSTSTGRWEWTTPGSRSTTTCGAWRVARPGGSVQLAERIGELHSQQVDRDLPLREINLNEGLENAGPRPLRNRPDGHSHRDRLIRDRTERGPAD